MNEINDLIKMCDSQASTLCLLHGESKVKPALERLGELKEFLHNLAQKPRSFAPGDVVTEDGDDSMIILEVHLCQGKPQYITTFGAWYAHADLTFVRKCTDKEWKRASKGLAKD